VNLERLRTLHAVSVYGSVAAAARALRITPSAASQQLAKLEREVGQRLFEREGRGIRLTEPAHRLVGHAHRILAAVEEAQADLEEHRGTVYGELNIAAFATAVRGLAPSLITALQTEYPELVVRVYEQDPSASLPALAHGTIDVAITQDWQAAPTFLPEGLASATLFHDVVDLAVPVDHRFARADVVDPADLAGERWISWPHGSTCHDWLVRTLRARGVEPQVTHSVSEHPTQLALIAAGHGIGIVPRLGRETIPAGVRTVRLEPSLARRIQAVWRAGTIRRPAISAALRVLTATDPDSHQIVGACAGPRQERG